MGFFSFLKKKTIDVIKKPLWEIDIKKYLESAGEEELNAYVKTLDDGGQEVNLTSSGYGSSWTNSRRFGTLIQYGSGFHGCILGSKKVSVGDYLLLKTESNKIGKYLVLHAEYCRDPNDMFWAYIVCVGHKE